MSIYRNRKFGELPEWAKTGPIDLVNYDLRMEWFGVTVKKWGEKWPFLSHNPKVPATADEASWDRYFRDHLGGFPPSYELFRDKAIQYLNMPEALPELFDPSYSPKVVAISGPFRG